MLMALYLKACDGYYVCDCSAKSVSREPNEADNDKNDDDVQQPAWKSTLRKVRCLVTYFKIISG